MSRDRAFGDEMDFLGQRRDGDELAAFARAARTALLVAPDPALTATLAPRLAEAARVSAARADTTTAVMRRPVRRRTQLVARVAIAAAALPVLSAGLAFAGVELPGPAKDAFERLGIELPNQTENAVSDENPPAAPAGLGTGDSADGKAQANGKRGHGKQKGNPARDRGRGNGKQGRGRALGKRGLAPGHSTSTGRAVGRTDSTPSGQAKEPPGKGSSGGGHANSGSSGGKFGGGKGRKK